jgi:hypothetical protein
MPDQRQFDLHRSLTEGSGVIFAFRKKSYEIRHTGDQWVLCRYNTRYDYYHNIFEVISEFFSDPIMLVRTATIDGITVEEIFQHHEDEMITFDRPYDYAQLMNDLATGAEIEFTFRSVPYALLNWAEGWEFSAGSYATVTMKDVRTLVESIKIRGLTMKDLFDNYYREDNHGELVIDGLSHSLADM